MFRILFTLVPVIFFGIVSAILLHTRWTEEYASPVILDDLTRDDWFTIGLTILSLIMIGILFNLIGLTVTGGN